MDNGKPFVKSPAFQIYPADFLADAKTLVMSAAEIGGYWLLLCVCWRENGLPDDVAELSDIARTPVKNFSQSWEKRIQRCFFKRDDGKWSHKRLEEERDKQAANREKRQKAGEKGAGSRWQTDSNAIAAAPNGNGKRIALDSLSSSSSISSSTAVAVTDPRGYPFDSFAVLEYESTLSPEPGLAIQQAEVIADAVTDSPLSRAVWTEVLEIFKGNGHQRRYAGNVVDRYKNEMVKVAEKKREPPAGLSQEPQRTPTLAERMGVQR